MAKCLPHEVEYKDVCVKKLVQHLRAQNDPNGNPQRMFVVYNPINGDVLEVIDEEYGGRPEHTSQMAPLPSINISRSDYHDWLREFKETGRLRRQ